MSGIGGRQPGTACRSARQGTGTCSAYIETYCTNKETKLEQDLVMPIQDYMINNTLEHNVQDTGKCPVPVSCAACRLYKKMLCIYRKMLCF